MLEQELINCLHKCAAIMEQKEHLPLSEVAARLNCSTQYVRQHLGDFPGAWRMPGGEIRIPARDIERMAAARRFLKSKAPK